MSINLTDELLAKTKKGKIASAKQVFLEGDQENLQQIGDKTHQLEDAIKDITVTGGASTANAVSYNNETSGMTAVTAQGAIDELAAKNATKAEKAEVTAELAKKFDKESVVQESGEAEDKVMSQKAVSDKLSDLDSEIYDLNTAIHGEKFIAPIQVLTGALSSSGSYSAGDDNHHVVADVSSLTGKNLTISGYYVQWGFLKTYKAPNASEWATGGRIDSSTKECINEEIPSDAKYIYVYMAESTTIPTFNVTPLQDGIDSEIADINNNLNAINDRIDGVDETVGTINAKLGRLNSSQLCKVQYFQGTFGTASEKLSIDIPCGECIIRYDLTHNITSDKMKDVWRIQYAYLVAYNKETPITINGEWECAFLINGQNDATGGDLHGYEEIQGDLYVFVDGTLKSASSLSDGKYFNDLKIVETTYMYKQDATKVAEHGREYTFNINGILLKQTLKFVESLLLDNCYMMMLPAAKSLTNKYYTDVDFVVNNIASLPIYKDGVKSFSILGNDFKANIISQNYPELPATLLIHDNGGRAYNKCYLFAAFNKNVSANTKFESSVLYQIAAAPISQETHYADYYPLTQGQTVASNGEPTSSDTYDLVTIILDRNALLWTNWNGGIGYTAIGYNGVRYRSSENNLPSSRNPLSVQANTPVYFSCVPQAMDESEIVFQYT